MVVHHGGVGVGAGTCIREDRVTVAHVAVVLALCGEGGREHHGVGADYIVEQVVDALRNAVALVDLRVHVQIDGRRGRELVRDVVLEDVVVVLDRIIIYVVLRCVHDTGIVVELEAHVIRYAVTTTGDVDVGALVDVHVAEHHILPVNVGVYEGVLVAARQVDQLLRVAAD